MRKAVKTAINRSTEDYLKGIYQLQGNGENVTSDDLEERIDKALGYPSVDPHGDPIPSASGKLNEIACRNLAECAVNERGVIVRVKDESQEILQLMTKLGLGLNTKIVVKQ